jgi:tetratricopeptide (TPR) repeat protein
MRTSQHGWMHAAGARKAFGLRIAALVAAGVAAGSSPALRADWVELVNGQRYDNVKIVSAKFDAVQYKVGNAAGVSTQTGDKVLTIFRESLLLQRPRQLLEAGDGEKALRDLTPIISGNLKDDDWQKAEAAFLIGRAHRAAGDGKKAIESFKAYLEKNTPAKDWFVPSATHEMAQTLLDLKQPGTAELSFKELAKYGGPWTLRAKLGEAMALIASKGAAAALPARTLCDEIVRTREAPRELKNQALVLRAKILLLQENPQQAAKELTDGFFTPGKAEVEYSEERAEASLLLGTGLRRSGRQGKPRAGGDLVPESPGALPQVHLRLRGGLRGAGGTLRKGGERSAGEPVEVAGRIQPQRAATECFTAACACSRRDAQGVSEGGSQERQRKSSEGRRSRRKSVRALHRSRYPCRSRAQISRAPISLAMQRPRNPENAPDSICIAPAPGVRRRIARQRAKTNQRLLTQHFGDRAVTRPGFGSVLAPHSER